MSLAGVLPAMEIYLVVRKDRETTAHLTMDSALDKAGAQLEPYYIDIATLDLGPAQKVAVFMEGRFNQLVLVSSEIETTAFCQGFCLAVKKYMGNAALYVLPDDVDEMARVEHPDDVKLALEQAGLK